MRSSYYAQINTNNHVMFYIHLLTSIFFFQFWRDGNQNNGDKFDIIEWLICGLNQLDTKFLGYLNNNYIFNTKHIDEQRITQNSNACVDAIIRCRSSAKGINMVLEIITYYGTIREIIVLNYYSFQHTLFKCD